MNIECIICIDLLIPSDEVVHTPCGHIFHSRCLKEWLERSETCPQCRQGTTQGMINKIYLSFSDSDIVETLTNKNKDLVLKLESRDQDINKLIKIKDELEKQTADLKHEISLKDVTIDELKDQIYSFILGYAKILHLYRANLVHTFCNTFYNEIIVPIKKIKICKTI